MGEAQIIFVVILVGLATTVFNIATVSVTLLDRNMRNRVSNYPVISFLVASTLQGVFAAPIYTYKKMMGNSNMTSLVCNLSRLTYFLSHHVVKASLAVVSFDRLVSIKYPYRYENYFTKRHLATALVIIWVATISIDSMPFLFRENDICHYNPNRTWSLCVIAVFSIAPFVVITVNYLIIWRLAVRFAVDDRFRQESLKKSLRRESRDGDNEMKRKGRLRFILELKATRKTLILLFIYLVCWGPLGVFYIIDQFCNICLSDRKELENVKIGIKCLSFSSSFFAPILYCWINKEYKEATKRLIMKTRLRESWISITTQKSEANGNEYGMCSSKKE